MTNVYPAETVSGVVTSFIPLTTVFTPTSGCTEQYRLNGQSLVAFDPGYGLDIDSKVVCAPSAVTTWWEQGRFGHGDDADHTAVSIGPLTCPDAWSTVVTSIKDVSSTQLMCCPSGYYLANGEEGSVEGECRSDVSSGMTLTFASTAFGRSETWNTATTTLTRSSIVGAIAVVGWNIEVESSTTSRPSSSSTRLPSSTQPSSSVHSYSSMHLSSITSKPSVTFISASSTSNGRTFTTSHMLQSPASSSTNPGQSSSSSSSGITTGTAIGIGLGVGLGVIGIASLIGAVYLLRRKKRKAEITDSVQAKSGPTPPSNPTQHMIHELHAGDGRNELFAGRIPAELYG